MGVSYGILLGVGGKACTSGLVWICTHTPSVLCVLNVTLFSTLLVPHFHSGSFVNLEVPRSCVPVW